MMDTGETAVLWLVNDHKELLLSRQPPAKRKLFAPLSGPGRWGASVIATVGRDEPPAHALLVEAQEVLRINPERHEPQELVCISTHRADGGTQTVRFMYSMVPANIRLIVDKRKASDTRWVSLDGLLYMLDIDPKKLVHEAPTDWPKSLRQLRELGLL
jgi:hypothetical protein